MFTETINGKQFTFETSKNIFSPCNVDKGTLAMLSTVNLSYDDKLLDLGCGYGIIGIYASKFLTPQNIIMSDVDEKCIWLQREKTGIKIN